MYPEAVKGKWRELECSISRTQKGKKEWRK